MKTNGLWAMIKNRADRERLYSTANYWDSKAIDLNGDAVSMWPNNQLNRLYIAEQLDLVDRTLCNVAGENILDVGCGTGRMSRYLASKGANVAGIDFSVNAIKIAEKHDNERIEYEVKSVFDIEGSQEYDIVFSWGCIAIAVRDSTELLDVLIRLRQSLKPRGRILMLEPVHRGFVHRVLDMDVHEFCKLMEQAGFEIHKVTQMHFWPMRYMLCFLPLPYVLTMPFYKIGQFLMKLPGLKRMGDYKAIYASVVN